MSPETKTVCPAVMLFKQQSVYPGLRVSTDLENVQQVSPLLRGGLQTQQYQHPGHMQEYPRRTQTKSLVQEYLYLSLHQSQQQLLTNLVPIEVWASIVSHMVFDRDTLRAVVQAKCAVSGEAQRLY
jgi:hypothetical protein